MVDRLLDFIVATALVSRYSFYVGQDVRGAYMASCEDRDPLLFTALFLTVTFQTSAALTFAVSCGLHALSPVLGSEDPYSLGARLMLPSETNEGLNRRIHAWWGVFLVGFADAPSLHIIHLRISSISLIEMPATSWG